MKIKLVIFNYWKGPSCQIWWTDVCRTFVFLCIKFYINYAQVIFSIFLKNIALSIIWGNLISLLLGITLLTKLWAKLPSDGRSAKTLKEFKRLIGGKDCAELIEIACMGCILCSTWHFYLNTHILMYMS